MPRQAILPAALDATGFRLLDEGPRDFPLEPRPFARIAQAVGAAEEDVIAAYRDLSAQGLVSRVGAVFAPRRLGASALAALAAPPERLEEVAARVTREPAINHNYQREHRYNLWFVVTAADAAARQRVLDAIARDTGLVPISLPLREAFHIDLGFDLQGAAKSVFADDRDAPCALSSVEQRLLAALEDGLPLVAQPFAALGDAAGISEAMTLEIVGGWLRDGIVKRFGVVVRHHELGYTANAMCVWNLPDDRVAELGRRLAAAADVTLCYRH